LLALLPRTKLSATDITIRTSASTQSHRSLEQQPYSSSQQQEQHY
jgi:hypothetical protein